MLSLGNFLRMFLNFSSLHPRRSHKKVLQKNALYTPALYIVTVSYTVLITFSIICTRSFYTAMPGQLAAIIAFYLIVNQRTQSHSNTLFSTIFTN